MDLKAYMKQNDEKPLDSIVHNGGFCGIFRRIVCVGDSLSSGEFETMMNGVKGYPDNFDYSWGQYLARDAGCRVFNFSRGGMGTKWFCENYAEEQGFWNPEKWAQAYIIALGVNDISEVINNGFEMGTLADIDFADYRNNKPTFAGYYGKIIQRYKEIEPRAKFFLMTIPKGEPGNSRDNAEKIHQELIYKIAELFSNTYVLDLREYAPVQDKEFKNKFYMAGHLNPAGYILASKMVISYIDYIIRHNMEDFKRTGFIGTEFTDLKEQRQKEDSKLIHRAYYDIIK